tara:strand:- start:1215 stop:3110 length:1896 start_codon:yes stop_codon:yes gene_type:complete
MFSSIEKIDRVKVVNNCYWPLLKLADNGIPFGLEVSALTLEIIEKIDSSWIKELYKNIQKKQIELVGSGYSQLIGPLVPYKVNQWNQKLGVNIYKDMLGVQPEIALVNEMAYSGGIIDHYLNVGYKGLIMEWNNPRSGNSTWNNEWRFYPQKAKGVNNKNIPLIWADSIAFQKFQRYAHGEFKLSEYINYIKSKNINNSRYFPLYSNDVEIFDYRPGRYDTETKNDNNSEWNRILALYSYLYNENWCTFIFPSDVLNGISKQNAGNELRLETTSQPIPVKKQEKYNINRWALSGRGDLTINTKCYQIYDWLMQKENNSSSYWKELCYLWSSDFRTHITEKRWAEYISRLDSFIEDHSILKNNYKNNFLKSDACNNINESDRYLYFENDSYQIKFNKIKGFTIKELIFKKISNEYLLGTLEHGYYDDIILGADFYSGHSVIERFGDHKVADLGSVSPFFYKTKDYIIVESNNHFKDYSFNSKIHLKSKKIIIEKSILFNSDEKLIIHPYNITFNPKAWDKKTLYIETHNGGLSPERFYMKKQNINHSDIYSSIISARHGFGNTQGQILIGDKDKSLIINCDMAQSALIPAVVYKEIDDKFFFRIRYSAREMDETIKNNSVNKININIHISTI